MNKQTAVEQVLKYFIEQEKNNVSHWCIHDLIAQLYVAKEMEQKQHREKWQEGWDDAFDLMDYTKKKGLEIKKNDLKRQLFIGKVSEILGADKTVELLKEVNNEIL